VGRPARLGRGGPGLARPRLRDHPGGALRAGLRLPRRDPAGAAPARAAGHPRRPAGPVAAVARARRGSGPDHTGVPRPGAPAALPVRPRKPRRAGLGSPRRPGRTVRGEGALRPQERRGLPDLAPAAPEPARHLPARRVRRADRGRGPDPEPGLDRPGRDRLRRGQPRSSGLGADHLLHGGLRAAQRLVQGFLRRRTRRPVRTRRS
jgi:hypothetical protein